MASSGLPGPTPCIPFLLWTLRLARARAKTVARLRNKPLDEVLATVRDAPLLDRAAQEPVLSVVHHVTDLWLRRVPGTRTSCLPRALARYVLLREAGVPVQLVLGLRPDVLDPVGHAWVELHGRPIMERETLSYHETFRYGA